MIPATTIGLSKCGPSRKVRNPVTATAIRRGFNFMRVFLWVLMAVSIGLRWGVTKGRRQERLLSDSSFSSYVRLQKTDDSGHFVFGHVRAGEYFVAVQAEWY